MKPYYLGVDGGGTKTVALLVDSEGKVKGVGMSGPVNYQLVGLETATNNLEVAIAAALEPTAASVGQIAKVVLGLAGLDFPMDWVNWTEPIARLLPDVEVDLVNDAWIALRAGCSPTAGVVSICGTGANAAGISPEGTRMIGRGMTHEVGCFAGAFELIRMSLNAAFRSANGSGKRSGLEPALLSALGLESYDQLAMLMYSQAVNNDGALMERGISLVPQLFQLADAGDEVVQDILICAGRTLGEEASAIIKGLALERQKFPIILGGSIWQKASNPLMRDAFALAVHRVAPQAEVQVLEHHPVLGAALLALEKGGECPYQVEQKLQAALKVAGL